MAPIPPDTISTTAEVSRFLLSGADAATRAECKRIVKKLKKGRLQRADVLFPRRGYGMAMLAIGPGSILSMFYPIAASPSVQ